MALEVWNKNIIGGRGTTAIPYMHVREMGPFIRRVLGNSDKLNQREVLIASPSETLSHLELFNRANIDYFGQRAARFSYPRRWQGSACGAVISWAACSETGRSSARG